MTPARVLEIRGLEYSWRGREWRLRLAELTLDAGDTMFLHGPSGTGKSTLLNLVAGTLAKPVGVLNVCGTDLKGLSGAARDRLRANHMGIIFQQFNLLPFLSMRDNVLLPCRFSRRRAQAAQQRYGSPAKAAEVLLARLGFGAELRNVPVAELSVGQQQRVAVARALIGAPDLVLADEPTSALDTALRDEFLDLLFAECTAARSALLFVSHDLSLAGRFGRQVSLASLAPEGAA